MKTELMLVTFRRDYRYLTFWLRGFKKYVRGIDRCTILVPNPDLPELQRIVSESSGESGIPIRCLGGDEWPGKGFNWHQAQICTADEWCPDADVIVHSDPDRVFISPFTPDNFIRDGKPIIVHATYQWLFSQQANLMMWKDVAERALGIPCGMEVMRRMPIPHIREVYPSTRRMVELHTRLPFDEYVSRQRHEFPQGFCEFNTIGMVAWEYFRDRYVWLDQEKGEYPTDVVLNCWSHREPTPEESAKFKEAGL